MRVKRGSTREMKGLDGSNPPLSTTESCLFGFSVQSGGIARAWGLICMMRGTGEPRFLAVRAQDGPKSLLASEAVPSTADARQYRFDDGLGRNVRK
jgi:hypothetical protein